MEMLIMKTGNIYFPSDGNVVCGQHTEDNDEMKSALCTGGMK